MGVFIMFIIVSYTLSIFFYERFKRGNGLRIWYFRVLGGVAFRR